MTELEQIEYAKMFIDKMANGINPLDNSKIKEDDLLNNIRISRCMFFVSNILKEVIDQGRLKKTPVKPLTLDTIDVERFVISSQPISITHLINNMNGIYLDAETDKIKRTHLTSWFLSKGLLEEKLEDNKKRNLPTELGKQYGISCEVRVNRQGISYNAVLYDERMQKIVKSRIPEIVKMMYEKVDDVNA